MSSLDYNIFEIKRLFTELGYTVFDITEFGEKKVTTLDSALFPVVFIGENLETINNEEPVLNILNQESNLDINIVLDANKNHLRNAAAIEIRNIKNFIANNRNNCYWVNWEMVDKFVAQLQSTNNHSNVYGGININTTISYREDDKVNDFWLSGTSEYGDDIAYSNGEYIISSGVTAPTAEQWLSGDEKLFSGNEAVIYSV